MNDTGWREKDDYTIQEIRSYLEHEKLDAFIPWKPEHIGYLTNYFDKVHTNILWEEMTALLVIPLVKDAFVVGAHVHWIGTDDSVKPWWITERHDARGSAIQKVPKALEETIGLLKKKGLGSARIGIEKNWLPVHIFDYLCSALPDAEFVSADRLVAQIRFIKNKREHMLLGKAAAIGLRAMEAYMEVIREGGTHRKAELERAKRALEYGGEFVGGPYAVCWTGADDVTPSWWDEPARRNFQTGVNRRRWRDLPQTAPFFVTHLEVKYQHYFSDLAWHEFYDAEPDSDKLFSWSDRNVTYQECYEDFQVIRRVQREAIQEIRQGMNQFEAKKAVSNYLQSDSEAKKRITSYFLHGIGLEVHEEPVLSFSQPTPIPLEGPIYYKPGAVISSEWFTKLWTVEEPFVMTEKGWEPLEKAFKNR